MKKLLFAAMMLLFATTANAQKDITKFLGIPIDGTKAEMIQKLKAKGFTSTAYDSEILEGEFNGENVNIHIATDHNRVYRIMVADSNTKSEANIRVRFNNLCYQFEHNDNYIFFTENQTIPQDEDISYEMTVNDKRYQASYYQKPNMDSTVMANALLELFPTKCTPEQYASLTEEERSNLHFEIALEVISKKQVWFTISEFAGEYYISMYYDNKYNESNGEDL